VFYRGFENRRQLASYVGIVPTPHKSGTMDRDRGISRAGNPRARATLIQLAWLWLRYQPGSELAAWFRARVGALQGRTRRIAIVAIARKLLIALWRYVETGPDPCRHHAPSGAAGKCSRDNRIALEADAPPPAGRDAFLIRGRRPPHFRWVAPSGAKPRERGIRVQGHPGLTACKVTQPSLRYDSAPDFEAQASAHRRRTECANAIDRRTLMQRDEARIGQKNGLVRQWARRGTRPRQPADQRYESAYLFGAICPARGTGAALALPHVDTEAMQLHLDEISRNVAKGAHAVLLLDRAGWHTTGKLDVPTNITPIFLPSRAPELNPVENLWQYLRGNWLSNRVFDTYDAIIDAACQAWMNILGKPEIITSIGMRDWAHVGQSS
jgi:transposase